MTGQLQEPEQKFYHITPKMNLRNILCSGLKSGSEVGKSNVYHDMNGNPRYIYLINEKTAVCWTREILRGEFSVYNTRSHVLIEIYLPTDHPLERDYDQLLFVLNAVDRKNWKKLWVEPFLERFGISFNGPLSEENLRQHLDLVPHYVYDNCLGLYRTAQAIPPEFIKRVGFKKFLCN